MKLINPLTLERRREFLRLMTSIQCTFDPQTEKAIRMHLVPSRSSASSLLHINGQHIIPLNHGHTVLLYVFIQELKAVAVPGDELPEDELRAVLKRTAEKMHYLYPEEAENRFIDDLGRLQDVIFRVARGEEVPELAPHIMTLAEYAPNMHGPIRMDLAVAPMRRNGLWDCPNACKICYASLGEAMQVIDSEELTTNQWRQVIDILWNAGVVQISFTGGDPLKRPDLPELVKHAKEFTTRVTTSAVLLTEEMAYRLHNAELDVMQITVYSHDPDIHDALVGRRGAWKKTMRGISIAKKAGIEVSVNTPLVAENALGYTATLQSLHEKLGVRYFTVSGMLPAGGAKKQIDVGNGVPQQDLYEIMSAAKALANELGCELDFTSPGCLTDEQLKSLGMNPPICGACLGNMAIAPDGEVLPCQSWVHNKHALGNLLTTPWDQIWNHDICLEIRQKAADKNECPLSQEG
jgi:MoaA/NifB/PqqE/SkfB family radical SAM enzyme